MDATEDDHRATRPRLGADFVSSERVAGMNPEADDVARLHLSKVERLQRFIGDLRNAQWRSGVAPARTNSHRGVITPTPKDR